MWHITWFSFVHAEHPLDHPSSFNILLGGSFYTSACIIGIVVRKLGHWQESYLVILFEIDKGLNVYLHCAVLSFGLAVCLRMEGSWESLFDVKEVPKWWSELRDEKWTSIRYD